MLLGALAIRCCARLTSAGDIGTCFADASKALKELKWKTTRDIDEMCGNFDIILDHSFPTHG